ncbi:MAG: ABC transporter ATP-binding protein [Planctomycetota bacterium]
MRQTAPSSVILRSIHARYLSGDEVLRGIDLDAKPGELTALIGPNGAGKSTLLRVISGVLDPGGGEVRYGDVDLRSLSPRQRAQQVATVPQARNLPPASFGYELVELGRLPYQSPWRRSSAEDREIVLDAMRQTGVENLSNRYVSETSSGESQRLILARAIAQSAPILLLDEATAHLDLKHQIEVLELVRSLAKSRSLCVIFAVHDLNLAALYADQVVALKSGQVIAADHPAAVLRADVLGSIYDTQLVDLQHPKHGTPMIAPTRKPRDDP